MTFSEFAQMLYPIIGEGQKKPDFIHTLICNIIDDSIEDDKPGSPINCSDDMLGRLFSGSRKMSVKMAGAIISALDKKNFEYYLLSFPSDTIALIYKALKQKGIEIEDAEKTINVCIDLFVSILQDRASQVVYKKVESTPKEMESIAMKNSSRRDIPASMKLILGENLPTFMKTYVNEDVPVPMNNKNLPTLGNNSGNLPSEWQVQLAREDWLMNRHKLPSTKNRNSSQ